MNIVFFGTPIFALPALDALMRSRHKVVAVVSQPNRAKDRKGRLLATPVAQKAEEFGLKLYQFTSVKKEGVETLLSLNADIFVTAAYGQMLSQEILDIPKFGIINVHASLLPVYRGSAPVHYAVLNGDKKTGVTIMQTRLALDSGEIILQAETDIQDNENTENLTKRLSEMGADLLIRALEQIENGTAKYTPQNDKYAVYCGKTTSLMSKIDWQMPADKINNLIRAVGGVTFFDGRRLKIIKAEVFLNGECNLDFNCINNKTPGEILIDCNLPLRKLFVKCGEGLLEIIEMVPAGGKVMTGWDFLSGLNGNQDAKGFKGENKHFE